ncbi:MAG: TonB-dependent receptor [Sedimentisphaerales bacterium]|nr:TonB-dependent receptor [Sedimentisphaerales bacterium]
MSSQSNKHWTVGDIARRTNRRRACARVLAVVLLASLLAGGRAAGKSDPGEDETLFDMSLEQLMEEEITSTASLTQTSARMTPAAMTTITADQIQASGARSLFELLDIYVPNLQWIRHHWESDHLGLRGIINDRDDKYLLLVNGRIMNERTHFGALSERDLVMLRDIHHIDVIRGPGSALYGPGAIAMVINIVTYSAATFQGTEVTGRLGAVEEFYSAEFKHGQTQPEQEAGVFVYAGIADYPGASRYDAPQVFSFDFPESAQYPWDLSDPGPDLPGEGYQAGEPFTESLVNRDGATHRNLPPLKLYSQITKGNWEIWGRYTRGGKQFVTDMGTILHYPWGWGDWVSNYACSSGYQQATGYIGYKNEIRENLTLDAAFSYDLMDQERILQGGLSEAHREDEFYGKVLFNWNANAHHKIAFGSEVSREEFGIGSLGFPGDPAISSLLGNPMPNWSTTMWSILGEHQWTIDDRWTTFLGARLDNHTYSEDMFSPRVAVIHTPNPKDTWRLLWSRSVRANFAEEMKAQALAGIDNSTPEKLDSIELRYERTHNARLDLAASAFFHYNLELLTWSGSNIAPVGTQREWGVELEAIYHSDKTRVMFSHGFTKLYDFDLDPNMSTVNTAEPYGFGDDLANWSNHVTKIVGQRKLNDEWTLDGSFRVYWGFPGLKDYNRYNPYAMGGNTDALPAIEPGWDKAYRGNYYLNLGLQYQPSKNLTVRLDGYNLLGMFDIDLNKRNYYSSPGDYRAHAAAVAASLIYRF